MAGDGVARNSPVDCSTNGQVKDAVAALGDGDAVRTAVKLSIAALNAPTDFVKALLANGHVEPAEALAEARLRTEPGGGRGAELKSLLVDIRTITGREPEAAWERWEDAPPEIIAALLFSRFVRR